MSITLQSLREAVSLELHNISQRTTAEATGDAATLSYLVAPHGHFILDDDTFSVTIDDVPTTSYSMDFTTGICDFTSAPADDAAIVWVFNFIQWTDTILNTAINAGIQALFPDIYVPFTGTGAFDGTSYEYLLPIGPSSTYKTITAISQASPTVITCADHGFSDGTTLTFSGSDSVPVIDGDYEITYIDEDSFSIPVNVSTTAGTTGTVRRDRTLEFVSTIDQRASSADPWTRISRTRYEIVADGFDRYVRFYTAPASGYSRYRMIARPAPLSGDNDTLEDVSGIPERAKNAIVPYACYYCLKQKTAPKVRSDVAVATQSQGYVYPTTLTNITQFWMMSFQFALQSLRMPPWMVR